MGFTNIRTSQHGAVLTITMSRPERLNALDVDLILELNACLKQYESDPSVRIIVLRGEGRAFSAGGDLKKHIEVHRDAAAMARMSNAGAELMRHIEEIDRVVIAVVEGLCVAGGLELILCCDMVIATETARFSDGHLNVALLPGAGGTQRLPRHIGVLRAKDLLFTSRFISGREAEAMGLVTRCVSPDRLEAELSGLVEKLCEKSFAALAAMKYLVNQGLKGDLAAGLRLEQTYVVHFESTHPDAHEGLLAFNDKRKPQFAPPPRRETLPV